jgi:predicted secreted protein
MELGALRRLSVAQANFDITGNEEPSMQRAFVSLLLVLMAENSFLKKAPACVSAPRCPSAAAGAAQDPAPKDNINMPGAYRSGLWDYEVIVTSPGSKSEGTRGRLFYAGKPVEEPGRGDYYRTPWGIIQWNGDSESMWGDHGWMPRYGGGKLGRELPEPWQLADGPIVMAMVLRIAEELPNDKSHDAWVKDEIHKLGGRGFNIERTWFPLSEQAATIYDNKLEGRLTARLCPTRDAEALTIALEGNEPAKVNLPRQDGAKTVVLRKLDSPLAEGEGYYLAFRVERADRQWPKVLDLGPEANGKVIAIKRDVKEVVIGLPGDLQSGAAWVVKKMQAVEPASSCVATSAKPQFISAPPAEAGTERRGVFENVFRVTGSGKTMIELEYRREWQTEVPADQTFSVTLEVQEEPAPLDSQVETIEWDTRGGGDFHFEVKRGKEQSFLVRVTRRSFRELDTTVVLTREKSRPVYDLVARLFEGKEEIGGTESPERGVTGTWTSVYVIDRANKRQKVGDASLQNKLEELRDWVEEQLPDGGNKPGSDR